MGGNKVTEKEYKDLVEMMQVTGLFEGSTTGHHFTWSNKHTKGVIYSRIDDMLDDMLGNAEWFQKYQEAKVYVMNPHISDHAPIKIQKARQDLQNAQEHFNQNLLDKYAIEQVKSYTDQVLHLNQMEESILMQKAKVDWLRLVDNNNAYFHPSIKEKNKQKGIYNMQALDGRLLSSQEDIEQEIVEFYSKLVGVKIKSINSIDIMAVRSRKTINRGRGYF
ncbi:unnamed protein product [Vicia faba]|uniref:Uncharacterized protein n=1 Tax=Vicia faba TaxID=3906 RepID=A0AAV1B9C1_VICFA|nr:unnamed protein product [Vicia faba]